MNLLKLITFLSILLSGLTYAQTNLDNYYTLEQEVAKLRAQFRDNQSLISEHNTTSNHFWSPSSTKKILDRLQKDQGRILKETEPKIKEMRRLEQTLEVQAWDYRFGALQQVNTILGNVSSNNTCSAQGQQLFTSDRAFEAWNAQNGDLDKKVAYYAEKNGYISNCLESKKDGDEVDVDKNSKYLCKKIDWLPDSNRKRVKKYKIGKKNGKISISTKLYFTFEGKKADREGSFKMLREAKKCMQDFFARHGIILNVTLHEETGFKDWWNCDHSINLHRTIDRANEDNWSSHGANNPSMDNSNRCALYIHEIAHKLGVEDSYSDPDCPDREFIGPKNDIMNGGSYSRVEESKFFPSAIKEMLRPLCGE